MMKAAPTGQRLVRSRPKQVSDRDWPIVAHREDLIYLLAEAAELEHGLMCSYLFAAFSLQRAPSELEPREQAAVDRWGRSILTVAMEEMLHLALVQNLLAAIGAAPHLHRPNFPVAAGLYPAGVVLDLSRFDVDTLDHFIFIERPEEIALPDGEGFAARNEYQRRPRRATTTPSAQDYETIGALYRGVEAGFEHLTATLGGQRLFLGDPSAQVGPSLLRLDGMQAVTDLASARRAIDRIIEQGEGGRRTHEESHFQRFTAIRAEFQDLVQARPGFDPAHPVVRNPVMNAPAEPERCRHIDGVLAARVLDVATAAYGLMVQLLMCFFCSNGEQAPRRVLLDGAITLMKGAVRPLAELLATLPASPSQPGSTAGLSFTLPRSIHALPRERAALWLLQERALQVADACLQLTQGCGATPELSASVLHGICNDLRSLARRLDESRG
jgi:hypothetical protein